MHELSVDPKISEISALIDWVNARCGEDGLTDETIFKITLALEEAVMNVISHAFDGRPPPHQVLIRLETTAARVTAEIIDNGHAFDPTAAPGPDLSLPLDQREAGGLGIHLMRSMTDKIEYRRAGDKNVLKLMKALA
ncbi:MAG TPA: ATP-binding protein [Stellaceae bacterium]|nr:ATP-binding protein [Stellaceae bacterium]